MKTMKLFALCLIAVWAGAVLAAGINTMKWI